MRVTVRSRDIWLAQKQSLSVECSPVFRSSWVKCESISRTATKRAIPIGPLYRTAVPQLLSIFLDRIDSKSQVSHWLSLVSGGRHRNCCGSITAAFLQACVMKKIFVRLPLLTRSLPA